MKVTLVAGARPNFMKIAPIIRSIENAARNGRSIDYRLVHTGQHFDAKMSQSFFEELQIPEPHVNLAAGGGSQAEQTAAIMVRFEQDLIDNPADMVLVVGDVNSTLACTITSKKLGTPVAHVEAGIRSGDMSMPEEINRIVTDSICDHFFTTSATANANLIREGKDPTMIHFVGNTMIDTLLYNLDRLREPSIWKNESLKDRDYLLLTLHRPANVDDPDNLSTILRTVVELVGDKRIVFPVHPRTRKVLDSAEFSSDNLLQIDPLGYLEFIFLLRSAACVITDSGGITEEATILNVPCLTLRDSTERPETIDVGTNALVGTDPSRLKEFLPSILAGSWKQGRSPELWDGKTSDRIVKKLLEIGES